MLISLVMFLKLQPIYINMTLAYIAQKRHLLVPMTTHSVIIIMGLATLILFLIVQLLIQQIILGQKTMIILLPIISLHPYPIVFQASNIILFPLRIGVIYLKKNKLYLRVLFIDQIQLQIQSLKVLNNYKLEKIHLLYHLFLFQIPIRKLPFIIICLLQIKIISLATSSVKNLIFSIVYI